MRSPDWKDIVEIVGIAAIVGSLIFVGLQLRQADRIAQNEIGYAVADRYIEVRNAIIENADVWERGNSGAELTASERVIYSNLIKNVNTQQFWSWSASRRMGLPGMVQPADLAGFLYDNPPAFEVWDSLQSDQARYRTPIAGSATTTEFSHLVREGIKTLEKTYNEDSH